MLFACSQSESAIACSVRSKLQDLLTRRRRQEGQGQGAKAEWQG